jgi:hexosaminidase
MMTLTEGVFTLMPDAALLIEPHPTLTPTVVEVAEFLAATLRPATGYTLPVRVGESNDTSGQLQIVLSDPDPTLGAEGYALTITPEAVTLTAPTPAGLFWGVQTIRQLLPPIVERQAVQAAAWTLPALTIRDYPRFGWRGMMLDVSRHFFPVADVKHMLDVLASYKLNRLHLHLSDDQGWRIAIQSWPRLATYGGSTQVGGGTGGYYTQAEYQEIVAYAAQRHIMIVPEIDMPGHTNAALASYAELNCDGKAPGLYTGTRVGFSSLCVSKPITYQFIADVVREIAALTPSPYFHIGGDESQATSPADYLAFIERVQVIVAAQGKVTVGWEEAAQSKLHPETIVQFWAKAEHAQQAVAQGAKLILSPSTKAYLDMKYTPETTLGLNWAGRIEVDVAYAWEPTTLIAGVGEADILGIEAPLWTETITNRAELAFMVLPRLLGYAEIGWSPAQGRIWDEYRVRLAAHGRRLTARGLNFYCSPVVQWD